MVTNSEVVSSRAATGYYKGRHVPEGVDLVRVRVRVKVRVRVRVWVRVRVRVRVSVPEGADLLEASGGLEVASEDDERGGVDGARGVAGERAAGVRYEGVPLDGVMLPLILYDLEDVRAVDVVIVGEQPKVHLRKGGWGGVHLRGGVGQGEGV